MLRKIVPLQPEHVRVEAERVQVLFGFTSHSVLPQQLRGPSLENRTARQRRPAISESRRFYCRSVRQQRQDQSEEFFRGGARTMRTELAPAAAVGSAIALLLRYHAA